MGSWSCKRRGEKLDTDNFECGGEEQGLVGFVGTDWDGRGGWDAQNNAFDSPPGIYPRDDAEDIYFYTSVDDTCFWFIQQAIVLSSGCTAEAKGLVNYEASGVSNGGVELPTGSF
jgi:hypothetical protein